MTHVNVGKVVYGQHHQPAPHRGEIWLAEGLLFNDGIHSKDRPVLVKGRSDDSFVCYKCTSKRSEFRERYEIRDIDTAGLRVRSYIDYDAVVVPRSRMSVKLGDLSDEDRIAFGRL